MQIPYDKLELQLALLGLDEKVFTEEKMKEMEKEISNNVPSDKSGLNKAIAEFHGISSKELIDSPNYEVLCKEYAEDRGKKLHAKIVEKFGITKKQGWAIMALAMGLLD